MAKKTLKTTIKLRRDTVNNYASHGNHIPLKGEVCIVDPTGTAPWAKTRNIRIKIGDGIKTWNQLSFLDQENPSLVRGYYFNNKFYLDDEHTEELEDFEFNLLYLDLHKGIIYYYDGEHLVANTVEVASASDERPGIMKLYQTYGQNTDGTMSQRAITSAIDDIELVVDEIDQETLRLAKPW